MSQAQYAFFAIWLVYVVLGFFACVGAVTSMRWVADQIRWMSRNAKLKAAKRGRPAGGQHGLTTPRGDPPPPQRPNPHPMRLENGPRDW